MRQLSEDQIEQRVERMMDHLDRLLICNQMPPDDYSKAVADLHDWAEQQYQKLRRCYA